MLENFKTQTYSDFYNNYESVEKKLTDLTLGFSIGGKWITKKGIVFELTTGIGRRLFNDYSGYEAGQVVGRGNLAIGYRF
jgi:hypothetical protein